MLPAGKTKAGKWRFLFLTEAAVEAILAIPRTCDWVFYNPRTLKRWHDLRKPWEAARKEAGYAWLQVKDLRRAYGIKLAESAGVEMHHIKEAMGHSRIEVTERYYAHYSPNRSAERVLRVLEGGK